MNRKERRAAQKRGGPADPRMAATLAQAFRAHQAGHRSDAERLYRDVLAIEPRNAAALHLLGALMHQSGQTDEAISLMRQAIAIESRNADYLYNLGTVLNAADRLPEAIEQLGNAIALKPQYAEAHFELGNVHARAGQLESAEKSLRRALELAPANAGVMNNLGRVLRAMRRSEDAAALWQRAVTLQPDLAIAHFNIGMIRHEQNRLDDAEQSLRRALHIQADYPEAVQELAFVLLERGRAAEALTLVAKAVTAGETTDLKLTFVRCLLAARELKPDAALRDVIGRAIDEAWYRPGELAPIGAAILKAHPVIGGAARRISAQWGKVPAAQLLPTEAEIDSAAREPFLKVYLESALNSDIDLERFLTALRAALLSRAGPGSEPKETVLDLCAALARQCFIGEYVFAESDEERGRIQPLKTAIEKAIQNNEPIQAFRLAAFAAYRPLYTVETAAALLDRNWPAVIAALLRQQIEEPLLEARLRDEVPSLTAIDDEVSTAVKEHYERNPYPRWIKPPSTLQARSVMDFVQYHLPGSDIRPLDFAAGPDVLIAGCGTGLQAIEAARSYRDAHILAVDVSKTSLAYARRHALSLDLRNVEFAQADILRLGSLGRSFDVIESTGVLHHLADPWAGWSVLISLLRPGGVMRIGLYSEIARRNIVAAQNFARQGSYQPDAEGIRLFRQNLLRLPTDNPATQAALSADFFSISACRDLLFHAHEHRLTLPEIQAFVRSNGLAILGLEATHDVREAFAQRFPEPGARTDLAAWHVFERENPDTFLTMYQFWLHKPRA